jgi:uncharacterized protein YdeI (YjbR/CyaY-like superfamily)
MNGKVNEMSARFFPTAVKFQQWLEKNHDRYSELWVGFHKKNSGKKSITYSEALDEALSYGWIDGVRKSMDETSYTIRFTPRKPKSIWSLVNKRRVEELIKLGRMKTPGLEAFARRDPARTGIYAFENRPREFSAPIKKRFRENLSAWNFFQAQPPGYKRIIIFWIMGAKQESTRLRRLDRLISQSGKGLRMDMMGSKKKS